MADLSRLTRRDFLKVGMAGSGLLALFGAQATLLGAEGHRAMMALETCDPTSGNPYSEFFPTSPLILQPFLEPLPIPRALASSDPRTWRDPRSGLRIPPGNGIGQQDSDGGTHQVWPSVLGLPEPICYKIDLRVNEHHISSSLTLPINSLGERVLPPDGVAGPRTLPASTIYGFNGTFPGPMINAVYGRPVLIRFENHLDENPLGLDRQDFGSPDLEFLTHLHNGHTSPESDGNPHYRKHHAYRPGQWVDNLYLNWCAGGDYREMQSFLWFHDHTHNHTGANVYKGMVGLYPVYDPVNDCGEERTGYGLPGYRTYNANGSFNVDYDIPLAFYDCCLDDGITPHRDAHNGQCETHPEWWGKTFFRHFPNHGFVGDIFTVNGKAYPVHEVKRRKYRLRLLGASIARCYEFKLMSATGGPVSSRDLGHQGVKLQGQWQLPTGQQCMRFTQVASDGGLLPYPITRDSIPIWPAKRREVIVDFSKYLDGSDTAVGDVVYLVNVLQMTNGRKPTEPMMEDPLNPGQEVPNPDFDPDFRVPVLKFVITEGGMQAAGAQDLSVIPPRLRDLPPLPSADVLAALPHRRFELSRRGGGSGALREDEWLINDEPFDATRSLAEPRWGSAEVWTIANGSGGWVHPLHIHQEEHQVIARRNSRQAHPDDESREDVVALDGGEEVDIYRQFRTFVGPYVCHCHNLAHEDHAMMFGWEIVP